MKELKEMTDKELYKFIRERLSIKNNIEWMRFNYFRLSESRHGLGFEMSGYDNGDDCKNNNLHGTCEIYNRHLLDIFSDIGIYDYTKFLDLDFYKGSGFLHYKLFYDYKYNEPFNVHKIIDFGNESTSTIIFNILKLTVLSDNEERRRS